MGLGVGTPITHNEYILQSLFSPDLGMGQMGRTVGSSHPPCLPGSCWGSMALPVSNSEMCSLATGHLQSTAATMNHVREDQGAPSEAQEGKVHSGRVVGKDHGLLTHALMNSQVAGAPGESEERSEAAEGNTDRALPLFREGQASEGAASQLVY